MEKILALRGSIPCPDTGSGDGHDSFCFSLCASVPRASLRAGVRPVFLSLARSLRSLETPSKGRSGERFFFIAPSWSNGKDSRPAGASHAQTPARGMGMILSASLSVPLCLERSGREAILFFISSPRARIKPGCVPGRLLHIHWISVFFLPAFRGYSPNPQPARRATCAKNPRYPRTPRACWCISGGLST